MKPYYTDYVRHMMRRYVLDPGGQKSPAEALGDEVCGRAAGLLREPEKSAILAVYARGNIRKNVSEAAAKYRISEERLWRLIKETEKIIARERGLL